MGDFIKPLKGSKCNCKKRNIERLLGRCPKTRKVGLATPLRNTIPLTPLKGSNIYKMPHIKSFLLLFFKKEGNLLTFIWVLDYS
jgi:hypothetical protein